MTRKTVEAIHAYYRAHTHRECALNDRIEAGWVKLLTATTLAGDQVTLGDAQIVIRYLQKRVVDPRWRGPRNPGCLKLTADNFFNVEKFVNDLAEARSILDSRKRSSSNPVNPVNPVKNSPAPERDPQISAGLRDFRKQMGGRE
jgi:hypothetical protein